MSMERLSKSRVQLDMKVHRVPRGYYERLLRELPEDGLGDIDYYLRFASIYTHRLINDRRYRDARGADYGLVHMDSGTLEDNLTSNYRKKCLNFLIDRGFFTTDGSYSSTAGKAIHYRYEGEILPLEVVPVQSKRFQKTLVAIEERKAMEVRTRWNGDAIDYIYACSSCMELNPAKSLTVVEEMAANPVVKASKRRKKVWSDAQRQESRTRVYYEMRAAILEGGIYRTVCGNGRVYNNWCNLPRPLRETCLLKGEPCYCVDIANSQVLIMCGVMLMQWKDGLSEIDIDLPMPQDMEDFIMLCERGQIYQTLMSAFRYEGTKDEFKPEFFRSILYSCVGQMVSSRMFKGFQQHYPTVANFLLRIKKEDYKRLANEMQAIEAALMIHNSDSVVMRCREQKIPVLTCHDAIICIEEHAKNVQSIMAQVFASAGLRTEPIISIW